MKVIFKILFVLLIPINLIGQKIEPEKYDLKIFEKIEYRNDYIKFPKSQIRILGNSILINDTIKIRFAKDLVHEYKIIIENGFLSPAITNKVNNSEYCCFDELKSIHPDYKTKRFKFWIYYPKTNNPLTNRINPDEYYFELQNEKGNAKTEYDEFIKGARLTFIKFNTIVI